jgi:hypothetical protein
VNTTSSIINSNSLLNGNSITTYSIKNLDTNLEENQKQTLVKDTLNVNNNTKDNTNNSIASNLDNLKAEESEKDDITISHAIKTVLSALIGGVTAIPIYSFSILKNLPSVSYNVFKSILNAKSIGPNLKTLSLLSLPFLILATPVFGTLAGSIFSLYKNAENTLENKEQTLTKTLINSIKSTLEDSDFVDKLSKYIISTAKSFSEIEPENGQKIDIKIYETLRGIASGLINSLIGAGGFSLVTYSHLPYLTIKLLKNIFQNEEEGLIKKITLASLVILSIPLVIALTPVAGSIFSFVNGVKDGYQNGFLKSINQNLNNIKKANDLLKELENNKI